MQLNIPPEHQEHILDWLEYLADDLADNADFGDDPEAEKAFEWLEGQLGAARPPTPPAAPMIYTKCCDAMIGWRDEPF